MHYDVAIAGGGPAGLSAAFAAASKGVSVLIAEQNSEIGSPTRTSGGSFIGELIELDIPKRLYHPIHRVRFLSPHRSAAFEYAEPILCVVDARSLYQHLATVAAASGATIWVASKVLDIVRDGQRVTGLLVETKTKKKVEIAAELVIDATGYKGHLLRRAGVGPQFHRYGVGAEFDMFAPFCDQNEAVLAVGSQFAPSGYGWVFPWGNHRVRVGVGVIHPDHHADPIIGLESFVTAVSQLGVNLDGAQPIEYHFGLIPSDSSEKFVGDGILGIGDAAGHASTLVGEGIRWAIKAGRMAGAVAAEAVHRKDCSAAFLSTFQTDWLRRYGRNLRLANMINRKISKWDDKKWDERTELLSSLSPEEFATALQTDFSVGWAAGVAWAHPRLVKAGIDQVLQKLGVGRD